MFDFSKLNKNYEKFSEKIEKSVSKFRIDTPESIWIDQFYRLRSKMYSFNCGDDSKNKLEDISNSQSKHNKFDKYKECLDGEKYQRQCDNFSLRSINHERYLQKVKKTTLSLFDAEWCYINETESKPWNYQY